MVNQRRGVNEKSSIMCWKPKEKTGLSAGIDIEKDGSLWDWVSRGTSTPWDLAELSGRTLDVGGSQAIPLCH